MPPFGFRIIGSQQLPLDFHSQLLGDKPLDLIHVHLDYQPAVIWSTGWYRDRSSNEPMAISKPVHSILELGEKSLDTLLILWDFRKLGRNPTKTDIYQMQNMQLESARIFFCNSDFLITGRKQM